MKVAKFGLIGHPVAGSHSPELFAAAYPGRGWTYDLLDSATFDEAFAAILRGGYRAVNVTAPFKSAAAAAADFRSPAVERIGAANILVLEAAASPCLSASSGPGSNLASGAVASRTDGRVRIRAYNSDYLAVRQMIESMSDVHRVLVVGYGGAGKAAATAAADLGHPVDICNRTVPADSCNRSSSVAPADSCNCTAPVRVHTLDAIPELAPLADLVIYTLPCTCPQSQALAGKRVIEANYRTPCLAALAGEYIPGTEWLRLQAQLGYPLMTGAPADFGIYASDSRK